MSVFDQNRVIFGLRRAGILHEDEPLNAQSLMASVGAIAERAYVPVQGRSDKDDLRLANEDLDKLTQQQLWRELKQAEFVAAWADVRDEWIYDRIRAVNKVMRGK